MISGGKDGLQLSDPADFFHPAESLVGILSLKLCYPIS